MNIIKDWPPNIEKIREKFEVSEHVCFTYGDTLYSPGDGKIPTHLMMHEETHMRQQLAAGGPEAWWERYLEDVEFRLGQEIEAYGIQLAYIKRCGDKNWKKYLARLSEDLAGPIYGYSIAFPEAYQKILAASNN